MQRKTTFPPPQIEFDLFSPCFVVLFFFSSEICELFAVAICAISFFFCETEKNENGGKKGKDEKTREMEVGIIISSFRWPMRFKEIFWRDEDQRKTAEENWKEICESRGGANFREKVRKKNLNGGDKKKGERKRQLCFPSIFSSSSSQPSPPQKKKLSRSFFLPPFNFPRSR